MAKMRTLVDIPEKQLKALTQLSKQRKTSRAALVREAVSKYLAENNATVRKAAIDAAFGIWRDREMNTMQYLDALRSEWD